MKNEMMVFEGRKVEVFEFDGKVLFNPKHVAECLDIADVNSSIRDMSDKQVVKLTNSNMHSMHFRKLHNTGENFLTESGVYKLIFKSRKPEAEKFQDWITDEVLPSIRKTGSYSVKQSKPKKTNEAFEAAKLYKPFFQIARLIGCDKNAAAISANQACMKLTGQNTLELLGQTHLEAEKQALYFTPTELGEKHGMSAREFNHILAEKGFQEKVGDKWQPTEKGMDFCRIFDTGKRNSAGTPIAQVKWLETVACMLN